MATTTVERCIINALKALGVAALQALKAALEGYILFLEGQLLILIAKAIPLEMLKKQLEIPIAIIREANNAIKNVSNLLPTGKVDGACISLSLINLDIADKLSPITGSLDVMEKNLLILLGLIDLNTIAQRQIEEMIVRIKDVIDAIDQVINDKLLALI